MTYTITTLGPKLSIGPAMSPVSPLSQDSSLCHVPDELFQTLTTCLIPFLSHSSQLLHLPCVHQGRSSLPFCLPTYLCLSFWFTLFQLQGKVTTVLWKTTLYCSRLYLLLQLKTKLRLRPLSCLISVLSLLPLHPHFINFCVLPILNSVNQINLSLTVFLVVLETWKNTHLTWPLS